jgi:hypothetical protein
MVEQRPPVEFGGATRAKPYIATSELAKSFAPRRGGRNARHSRRTKSLTASGLEPIAMSARVQA